MAAVVLMESLRPAINAELAHMPPNGPFADAAKLPNLIDRVALFANITGEKTIKLAVKANNEVDAEQSEQIIAQLMTVCAEDVRIP